MCVERYYKLGIVGAYVRGGCIIFGPTYSTREIVLPFFTERDKAALGLQVELDVCIFICMSHLLWATLEQLSSPKIQSALSTFGIFSVLAGCLWDLRISKYSHTGGEGKMPQHCTVHCHAFIWPEFTRIVWGWHWRSPWTRQTWHTWWRISYLEISLSMWLLY